MKIILTILILICAFMNAKAQTPGIRISYDANGNRILRYLSQNKAAPPSDSSSIDSTIVFNSDVNSTKNGLQAIKVAFKVYPNPSDNNFNIAIDAAMLQNNYEIVLTDQLGKTHFRKVLTQSVTTISTQQFADGVYYITINNGNSRSSVRIVKQSN